MTDRELQQNIEEVVREAASFMTRDFTVESKGSIANQVTSSDVAVESFLKEQLERLLPGSGFIAEESGTELAGTAYTGCFAQRIYVDHRPDRRHRKLCARPGSKRSFRGTLPEHGAVYRRDVRSVPRRAVFCQKGCGRGVQRQSGSCLRPRFCAQPFLHVAFVL